MRARRRFPGTGPAKARRAPMAGGTAGAPAQTGTGTGMSAGSASATAEAGALSGTGVQHAAAGLCHAPLQRRFPSHALHRRRRCRAPEEPCLDAARQLCPCRARADAWHRQSPDLSVCDLLRRQANAQPRRRCVAQHAAVELHHRSFAQCFWEALPRSCHGMCMVLAELYT